MMFHPKFSGSTGNVFNKTAEPHQNGRGRVRRYFASDLPEIAGVVQTVDAGLSVLRRGCTDSETPCFVAVIVFEKIKGPFLAITDNGRREEC